jgi:preprotein translocase SecE subunit
MATIGKEPATETTSSSKPVRPTSTGGGAGSGGKGAGGSGGNAPPRAPRWLDRQRENIRNIMAELNKVTWPTREETRNLTIVVIGISVVLGTILASLDGLFSLLYRLVNP